MIGEVFEAEFALDGAFDAGVEGCAVVGFTVDDPLGKVVGEVFKDDFGGGLFEEREGDRRLVVREARVVGDLAFLAGKDG